MLGVRPVDAKLIEATVLPVVARVPLVGSVRLVDADTVSVIGNAPLIVRVLAVLFATPVPPRLGAMTAPFHVALVMDPA